MSESTRLDCVVVGYNETPFVEYEATLRRYGEDSEAYRDLKFSFVDLGDARLNYADLLNRVYREALEPGTPHREFLSGDMPSLAAVYLTSFLRRRGLQSRYINLFQYEKEPLAELLAANPRAIALTTTLYVLNEPVIEMVKFIRQHNPDVRIIVGGPLIANHFRRYQGHELATVLDDLGADLYVVEGQGELTLARILETLRDGGDLSQVPNLAYVDAKGPVRAGRYRINPREEENNPLDENLIDWNGLSDATLGPTLQTRTARSCAYSCSFCAYPMRAGSLTLASLDAVGRELDAMAAQGARNVVFIDDTFNVPLKRFKELCRLMIERQYGFNWFSYFRCSNADEESVELAARSGCRGVFLGIESGSPTILTNMNKAASVEKYTNGMRWLKSHGILTFASFIVGFPGETDATVQETLDFIQTTRPDYYRAQLWYCEPGTPIEGKREQYGITGQGFSWRHATMESLEAMDHIDRMFLTVQDSTWLPQWSFDFWIIPYMMGRGMSLEQFNALMRLAHRLLALEVAYVPPEEKRSLQQGYLRQMRDHVRQWGAPALAAR
ncbi:PhpK family radical SAM P-methyltransferase [Corallococcus sp. ZKHCc1 1396]|uniref:PhpK family radical SAM P-methyltransferase n=1 Tax=Corallococcus soli TaxID=2710757 RepID=A0ABR9PUZ4_9BACT|nr:PhpK family radical SAM P-methyltransferase [Corallococcus soli]MBE4751751.1 PhpK family radical SAM P-methyltransferase [Corallococcus soli]